MTAPTATITGPLDYPTPGRHVAGRTVTIRCVGPDGAVLRTSDGGLVGETTVHTDAVGMFEVDLALNSDIDDASGVGPPGTYWRLTVGTRPAASWQVRLEAADAGATIPIASGTHTVVDPQPRTWVPLAGTTAVLPPGALADRPLAAVPGQSFFATDTGETYVWTGTVWSLATRLTQPIIAASSSAPSTVTCTASGQLYVCPELVTVDVPATSGLWRVDATSIVAQAAVSADVYGVIAFSADHGSTWAVGGTGVQAVTADFGLSKVFQVPPIQTDPSLTISGQVRFGIGFMSATPGKTVTLNGSRVPTVTLRRS